MPRPATFSVDAVIDRAMLLFWARGYTATSIQDLVEDTALLRGSLYHTFGDKRSLYMRSLRRYGQLALRQTTQLWNPAQSLQNNVRAMLLEIVDMPTAEKQRGSMVCNCIVELAPHDAETTQIAADILNDFKALFQSWLEHAQRTGELSVQANTVALARFLASSIQGLCVTAKAGASRAELLDVVEITLAALR
jgi:TetR/AcrR family transcriptional regulator, transcriptional repressor for nem operon